LVLVLDPALGEAEAAAQRTLYADVMSGLGRADRVAVVRRHATDPEVTFVEPGAEAAAAVARLRADGVRPASRGGGSPVRAPAPTALLERVFDALEAGPAGRRVVVTPAAGPPDGRRWQALTARAAAVGADLHVLGFAAAGRRPPRARVAEPLYVFPVDIAADTTAISAALREAVAGGMWAAFDVDLPPVGLVDGFALRARLPRGGWEDFGIAPLETSLGGLWLDGVSAGAKGRCVAELRVMDAARRGILPGRGEVSLQLGDLPASALSVEAGAPPVLLVIVYDRLGGEGDGIVALRAAAREALRKLGPADRAILAAAGQGYPEAPDQLAPAEALRDVETARWPAARAPRDVLADLEELRRRLGVAPPARRVALLVLSGPAALRSLESAGGVSPRLRGLLAEWRRGATTLLWAVAAPAGRSERAAAEITRAGGALRLAGDARGLTAAAGALAERYRTALALGFDCGKGAHDVAPRVRARVALLGRLLESAAGAPILVR